jgi:hypothetical protein
LKKLRIHIETYRATDEVQAAGPRAHVAYLHVTEGACMNFWAPTEPEARAKAEAWLAEQIAAEKAKAEKLAKLRARRGA